MSISKKSRRNIKSIIIFTSIMSIGTTLNAFIEHGFKFYPLLYDFTIGLAFGLIISITEIYVFEKKLRRLNFTLLLFIRTFYYVFVAAFIIVVIASTGVGQEVDSVLHDALQNKQLEDLFKSEDFDEILMYTVFLSFVVNFVRQINRLLGQRILFNYATGKYHIPVEEELIFMFLDLKSSTTIAEKIGLIKNHHFLNDFFYDLTEPILECKAKVYQYVGDEVVLTWKLKDGVKNLNCLNCFYMIQKNIEVKKDIYLEKYGVYPEFKAGLHFGGVIAGEIGDIKKDIAYHGDTVNTTARIQAECNKYGKKVLVSKELINELELNNDYKIESMGFIKLRGKEKELELFAVEEK